MGTEKNDEQTHFPSVRVCINLWMGIVGRIGEFFGTSQPWTNIHLFLLSLRLLFTMSTGYPHPDEFFQSPEIAAADIFNFNVFIPWEFANTANPCRSIISPLIGSGISYTILSGISIVFPFLLNFFTLLIFPRLFFFILSLLIDYTASKLCYWNGKDAGIGSYYFLIFFFGNFSCRSLFSSTFIFFELDYFEISDLRI